jgi:hypothetical protein
MELADAVVKVMALGSVPGPGFPSVKVAILDTGVKPSHAFAKTREYRSGQSYKDFVEDGEEPDEDNTKHGTEMLDLVLRMHAYADVYVARIFETERSSGEPDAVQMANVRYLWR